MNLHSVSELPPPPLPRPKRGEKRFLVNLPARLTIPGTSGTVWNARIRDISKRGMQLSLDRPIPGSLVRIDWSGRHIEGAIRYQQAVGDSFRLGVELTASWDSLVSEVLAQQARELESTNRALERALNIAHEAMEVKARFLAGVTHELRTPLNGIIGFAQLLHDGKIGPVNADQRDCLADILSCSDHLLGLVTQLLDIAKADSGKMTFQYRTVSPAQLAGDVVETLWPLAEAKRIAVEIHADPTLGTVAADPGRLKQVLYNYLSNALKFTPAGGAIHVSLSAQASDYYRIEVSDTGPGIAASDIPRLFAEFSQLELGKDFHQGTGLGLAITKRIVEAQGGRVGVESCPGEGSRFYAVLPIRPRAGDSD